MPENGDYETVGGFVMAELGRLPVVGDEVAIDDGTLVVQRLDGRRIDRVRFLPTPTPRAEASETEGAAR